MGLFVLPISWVGQSILADSPADTYVISLPLALDAHVLALLAFIGGTSAASGMVIVATIALTIMMSNDLVLPLLLRRLRFSHNTHLQFSGLLLNVRRGMIVFILSGAWAFYMALDSIPSLSVIGLLSFAAIAQFAPALIGGIYWRLGNRKGVYAGLLCGFTLWLITLMGQTGMLAGDASSNLLLLLLEICV